jgi:PAS domain S-box-containing protein
MSTSLSKQNIAPGSTAGWTIDYHELFDMLPHGYIVVAPDDPNFTVIAENKAHAAMAFSKDRDIIGMPLLEAFPDTSGKYQQSGISDIIESIRRTIESGRPDSMAVTRYDLKHQGKTTTKQWRVTHYPMFVGSGPTKQLSAIFQTTEDITEKVSTDNRLSHTEHQLDEVMSVALIATWLWDVQKNIVIGDKFMADMFGLSVDEVSKGMPSSSFIQGIHPGDRARVKAEIAAALKQDNRFESEYRTINKVGYTRWVLARGRIERDNTGKPTHFPGVLVDITQRKLAESNLSYLAKASAALSVSLDYYKTLQTIAELMVPEIADWCTVDMLSEQGKLELVALAHKDPEKVKWAHSLRKKQGPPDLDSDNGTAVAMRTGEVQYFPLITDEMLAARAKSEAELKLLRDLSFTSVIIVPITVAGKNIGAISMISADLKRQYTISDVEMAKELANRASLAIANAKLYKDAQRELKERTRLEEELRLANEELEHRVDVRTSELEQTNLSLQRSNQELQDFAYVASHDLQEPLRKIQAFGNLLETEYAPRLGTEGADYLKRMRNAAARMSSLIEDILSFSRVTTKGREFTAVNLQTVAKEVVEDLEIRIADTRATVTIGDLPTIQADAMQMRQLLQNLIANALKFHREDVKPVITVSGAVKVLADKTKICQLEVADNGLGFEERYLHRIFAVFQRLHNRDSYEGTGIGLAVCRKIVERHGGFITAKSKLGKGSTFIVTLPVRHKKGENLL